MNHKIKYLAMPLCLILLLTPACKTTGTSSSSNGIGSTSGGVSLPGSGGTTTSAAISENDKPLDVMTRAMRAQLDAKSYRAHVTSSLSDGANNAMEIEYVAPDRYRMSSNVQVGGKGVKQEFVIVGGATYIKAPNGWVKSPVDASGIVKAFRDPKMLDELAKTADVKFVGADTIDGAPMLVYQYTQNNPMGMNLKSTSKTWLSVADGLPRKTETDGEYQGKKTKTLVTISDYNADIKIESPMK
jgi:outer membrane lipoprotein-sorting protein